MISLYDYQLKALSEMKNGCILAGEPGTGKSRTAIAYYYIVDSGGKQRINGKGKFELPKNPRDLYIITTAKKRDNGEWLDELSEFQIVDGVNELVSGIKVTVDSWNNIKKYRNIYGAFFIFDEQRTVSGTGAWTKAFLDICRKNHWIMLSATPGDKWIDYAAVFIANGFYRNITEFRRNHCVYNQYSKHHEIAGYLNESLLHMYRNSILVPMEVERLTIPHYIDIWCNYDRFLYKSVHKDRWDPYENRPIRESAKLLQLLRKVVNSDASRIQKVREILSTHRRAIIFYNYNYELYALRAFLSELDICTGEWNGELHTPLPTGDRWCYLVQYMAGCEGWNCITTDTVIFYSQSYSYRQTKQAEGRIDRANTPYIDLYYYYLKSKAPIDISIERALKNKKDFNQKKFLKKYQVDI